MDPHTEFIVQIIFAVIIGAVVGVGIFGLGWDIGKEKFKEQAVKRGFAKWIVKPNRETEFQWNGEEK